MHSWMKQVSRLRRLHGIEVIWVTSGAIPWAIERTDFKIKNRSLPHKQALSAIGQPLVMNQYLLALQASGTLGAQVLLTADDMGHSRRRENLVNSLKQLLRMGVVPILNENDAVATEEIQFGDNDSLAAQVATVMDAAKLVLLTDVDGLYDANPKVNPKAQLVTYRKGLNKIDFESSRRGKSTVGTGGMYSKLLASQRAQKKGIVTHLVRGDRPNILLDIATGNYVGTQIGGSPRKVQA